MNRDLMLATAVLRDRPWDAVIIGGGATGAGCAVDAASRGYSVLLLERADFGSGTSSRSTKLVHGGVRYLARGEIGLVTQALHERAVLRRNAGHLVKPMAFVVPAYEWWERAYYAAGLTAYDLLAGADGFGRTARLSREQTLKRLPNLRPDGLRGGVLYFDGQFDDARLLINLIATAADRGACVLNHVEAVGLTRGADGRIDGVTARDAETGRTFAAPARSVINAAGAFCDSVRRLADPGAQTMIAPSRGSHLVLDGSFLGSGSALMIPRTPDGRVLFAIPWHGRTLVGTTDVSVDSAESEPRIADDEIEFLLETAGRYLARRPTRADVLATFAGIRPLVRGQGSTAALTRDHTVRSDVGLITVAGGKWTTYRAMARDAVDAAAESGGLPRRRCTTETPAIHGSPTGQADDPLAVYGSDAPAIREIARTEGLHARLHPELEYIEAEAVWAARCEMARTVDDVLSRRTRALHLNARAAFAAAPRVAELLAGELGKDRRWEADAVAAFRKLHA